MKTWMNFETGIKVIEIALRRYLDRLGITYETSGCYDRVHFEILIETEDRIFLDAFLDGCYAVWLEGLDADL